VDIQTFLTKSVL